MTEMKAFLLYVLIAPFYITFADPPIIRGCRNDQFECINGDCISKSYWCSNYNHYCRDNSDRKNCGLNYPHCVTNQTFCKDSGRCIPVKWACDGYMDCTDNSDEQNCLKDGFRIGDIPGVIQSKHKGHLWLIKQRRPDWGWGKDTARVIAILRLSDYMNFTAKSINISSQLMFKQLQLHISETFLKNDPTKIKEYEIASYVHSLLAICSDPRNFQGFDLVKLLKDKIEESEWINPIVALAICNSNQTLLSWQIEKLEEVASTSKNSPHWIDTRAYALMALMCLRNQITIQQEQSNARVFADYDGKINKIKRELTKLQNEDGSLGNLYTTAILIHTLLPMEVVSSSGKEWSIIKAINYVISQQKEDGSFGDSLATYLILPILNGKTFMNFADLNCSTIQPRNLTVQEEIDSRNVRKHHVKYFIIVGQDKDIVFHLILNVPINSTFYDVMRFASELDYKFRFNYANYPWGKYIYSIFGLVNDPEKRKYWQLYKGTGNSTVYLQSPDNVITKENETYIYWYKPIDN